MSDPFLPKAAMLKNSSLCCIQSASIMTAVQNGILEISLVSVFCVKIDHLERLDKAVIAHDTAGCLLTNGV